MGNNKQFKLNNEQMQQFFDDWQQAFAEGTQKNIFCENESIKFGVSINKNDLNYWLKTLNPTLFESTKVRNIDNTTPRAPRTPKPRVEKPQQAITNETILNDATINEQLHLNDDVKPNYNQTLNNGKIDNTGCIKIACAKVDERILKIYASLKDNTIKNIVLDALALYYAQDENKKAYEKAIEQLKEIY